MTEKDPKQSFGFYINFGIYGVLVLYFGISFIVSFVATFVRLFTELPEHIVEISDNVYIYGAILWILLLGEFGKRYDKKKINKKNVVGDLEKE